MARWEFAFEVDRSHGMSFVQQIARALTAEIQRGRLRPGDRLPGSRTLARTLRVHRQTVVSADRRAGGRGVADQPACLWRICRELAGAASQEAGANCAKSRPPRL